MRTISPTVPLAHRAHRTLARARLEAPVTVANTARNARAEIDRHARWTPARDAAWQLIAPLLHPGARVGIVGAGNGDTLPLTRIAAHAREVALIDLDPAAIRAARRRRPRGLRPRITLIEHDITVGGADRIAAAAAAGEVPEVCVPEGPLPGGSYDLVIGDLFYSQLLYPALLDLELPERRACAFLERYGPILTRSVVSRMHASTPLGRVVHIHDPIAWWPGHPQPVTLEQILALAERDPDGARAVARTGSGPRDTDPLDAVRRFAIPIQRTAVWHWPFTHGVDYLAAATIAGGPSSTAAPGASS